MTSGEEQYDIAEVRNLIRDAFTADDLRRFCQDHPLFCPVLGHFGATFESMIDALIEYCQTRVLLADLLSEIRQYNPKQYERRALSIHRHEKPLNREREYVIPHNLPPRRTFIGREREKARVVEGLASREPLTCIDGIGGIGKTVLALEVAHECLQASRGEIEVHSTPVFDGFIWTTAKDRKLTLGDILDIIGRILDYPGIVQQSLDEKRASVCELFRSRPCLLIVDNFETVTDEAVGTFLLQLPEPSKGIVTSREQRLTSVWAVSLKGMERAEALILIRNEGRRLGLASVGTGDERTLLQLHQATGGAPLAIEWAVGQIKQRGQSLNKVLASLQTAEEDIFEEIFARSWSMLQEAAQRILVVMPLFATSASRAAVKTASDIEHLAFDEGMGQLVQMRLVEVGDQLDEEKQRYSVHPLTRAYVQRGSNQFPQFIVDAQQRLAFWMLELAKSIGENRAAFDRLEEEFPNIVKSAEWCHRAGQWQSALDYRYALLTYLEERGDWDEALKLGTWAIRGAEALNDQHAQGWCCFRPFGWVHRHREALTEAKYWFEKGLSIFEGQRDDQGINWARVGLGDVAWREGEYEAAGTFFEDVRVYAEASGDNVLLITALAHLSRLARAQGDFESAEAIGRKALKISEEIEDLPGLAASSSLVAKALLRQGKLDQAEKFLAMSLELNKANGIRHGIAWNKATLAQIEESRGSFERAYSLAREAHELHDKLGMKREMQEMRQLLERLERQLMA